VSKYDTLEISNVSYFDTLEIDQKNNKNNKNNKISKNNNNLIIEPHIYTV
jgi:hypothetical protein